VVVGHDLSTVRPLAGRPQKNRALTKTWDKTIFDCPEPRQERVKVCYRTVRRSVGVHAYANNHYAGHGPGTARRFEELQRQRESAI
jgi:hypothetical protein